MQRSLRQQRPVYSNRTDLIRTAIRNQLATHAEVVRETVARKTFVLGLQHYTRRDLEAAQPAGQKLQIQVLRLPYRGRPLAEPGSRLQQLPDLSGTPTALPELHDNESYKKLKLVSIISVTH
ncbi:MAG: hypothetical protein ACREUD_05130 [Gammaproteobacteria bacterium]